MTLADEALVTLVEAKNYLKVDAVASLQISAEFVGVGTGSAVEFELDETPISGSLKLYVNNVLQVEDTDFTIATATITFTTAPTLNHGITANYDYAADDDTFESYDDLLLENLIEAATEKAEEYTGRAFIQRTVTESHQGDGTKVMMLYKRPISAITSVVREISEAVGTGDDSTVVFTLDETPTTDSLSLYVDGTIVTDPLHYSLSGATITFASAPTDGAKITATYTHTILHINEYTQRLSIGRLYNADYWTDDRTFTVVYTAGYAATRAATQALIPDAVAAVLLILSDLYENRGDRVASESITGLSSTTYKLDSRAKELLDKLRVNLL